MNLFQDIVIFINGQKHIVNASTVTPQTTLNTYLRDNLSLTGTKRMCLEGGCGTCIVSVKRSNPVTGKIETLAINSCLVSIFSCFGWDIHTIEGLGNSTSTHVLQNVLVKFNGTQCGYCSPGMIMNMYALQKSAGDITMAQVENSFGGNICRCTGYRSILSAFKSLCKDARSALPDKFPDIEDMDLCRNNCNEDCTLKLCSPFYFKLGKKSWIRVFEINDLMQILKSFHNSMTTYTLVAGNTGKGVYKTEEEYDVYVDISSVTDLLQSDVTKNRLILGSNISLANAMDLFYKISRENIKFKYLKKLADHIDLIANVPVRNMGTLAGNLMLKHKHKGFASDVFLLLETVGAQIQAVDMSNREYITTLVKFLEMDMSDKILKKIILPALDECYFYESYKIMPRAQNAHALVNAGFLLKINEKYIVEDASIIYGCISPTFTHATKTEMFLIGRNLFKNETLQECFQVLNSELVPEFNLLDPEPKFRKKLGISLFYKYILSITPTKFISKRYRSGGAKLLRPLSTGAQHFETNESLYPLSQPMPKVEAIYQTTGEAEYIMDMPDLPNQLYAAFVVAKASPHSKILKISKEKALNLEGVVAFFDKNDIPGRNTFTPKEPWLPIEEELFCSGIVKYHSQPVGIIVATSQEIAERAAGLVEISYVQGLEKPAFFIRDILRRNIAKKIIQEKIITPKYEGENIKYNIRGTIDLFWQYHFHMEAQCCNVIPKEDGLDMYPGSQWMDLSQNSAAVVLNIPANKINVVVRRLGGAFGGKIVRSSLVSSAAALAAYKLRKPVKLWLPLETNMKIMGKRFPLSSDYEVATDEYGVIQYLRNKFYYDHGAAGNECILFFLIETYLNTYKVDSWYTDSSTVSSDMHPNAYIRAPASAEGFSMCEAIMEHTAMSIHMDPLEFRIANLSERHDALLRHIEELKTWAEISQRKNEIHEFNKENRWRKRGLSVVPMAYPLKNMFSYGVIVSIYHTDGSVALSHGGVEIGQGINTKAIQVCAHKLGIPTEKVTVKPSNNLVAPNSSMTGASLTSEAVCWGILKACDLLLARMKPVKDTMTNPTWEQLVNKCYEEFVNLSASSMYSPKEPELKDCEVYGVCAAEVELDVLTGQYQILRVDLLEDVGNSVNPNIDIGQVEGAFVMGVGYFTTEQIVINESGEILTNRTWNYKPPGAKDIPIDFRVKFATNTRNSDGILKSKGNVII